MNVRRLAAGVVSLALLGACSSVPMREAPVLATAPEPVNRPMSCLAMSGGGIRSGAVSLGAIQGLYEEQALARYELISTVSGGGYPVYGLLVRMTQYGVALNNLLREQGRYFADVERNASFIMRPDLVPEAILHPTLAVPLSWVGRTHASAQPAYIGAIHNTFVGSRMPRFGRPMLSHARNIRELEDFPLPIFGVAASDGLAPPRKDYPYKFERSFELSPQASGAPAVGYSPDLADIVSLGSAIAMSAAALETPQGELQAPAFVKALNIGFGGAVRMRAATGEPVNVYLSDGGFIENLGLLPLLRRGCTEILAFDNSDDVTKTFGDWRKLAKALAEGQEPGWRISQPLKSPVTGRDALTSPARWELPEHIWDAQLVNGERRVHVRLVKLGISHLALSEYPEHVQEFARQTWAHRELKCTGNGMKRRCPFPLESTARQSFLPEEFRAYRHLGRWLAKRALSTAPPEFEPKR